MTQAVRLSGVKCDIGCKTVWCEVLSVLWKTPGVPCIRISMEVTSFTHM